MLWISCPFPHWPSHTQTLQVLRRVWLRVRKRSLFHSEQNGAAHHHLSTGFDTLCWVRDPYARGKESICTWFYKAFYSPQHAWVYSQIPHNIALCWGQRYHGNDRSCQTTEETPQFNKDDPLLSSILRRLKIGFFALQEGVYVMATVSAWTAHCAAL